MKKLSKSDKIDKDQEAAIAEATQRFNPSKHFAVGTFVVYKNERGEVMSSKEIMGRHILLIRWPDGSIQHIYPRAPRSLA